MGEVDRQPTSEELERMKGQVRKAMEPRAIGLSTALILPTCGLCLGAKLRRGGLETIRKQAQFLVMS